MTKEVSNLNKAVNNLINRVVSNVVFEEKLKCLPRIKTRESRNYGNLRIESNENRYRRILKEAMTRKNKFKYIANYMNFDKGFGKWMAKTMK